MAVVVIILHYEFEMFAYLTFLLFIRDIILIYNFGKILSLDPLFNQIKSSTQAISDAQFGALNKVGIFTF